MRKNIINSSNPYVLRLGPCSLPSSVRKLGVSKIRCVFFLRGFLVNAHARHFLLDLSNVSFEQGASIRFSVDAGRGKGLEGNALIKELWLGSSERQWE